MLRLRKVILPIILALVVIGVPACDFLREAEGPTLQVLSPQDFAQVQLGESVDVVSTATDPQGVTRVELYVGEDLYRTDGSPTPEGETSWTFTQTWTPTAPGSYTLTVVAYNVDGVGSTPWAVAVEVVEGATTGGTPVSTIPPATGTPPPGATGTPPPPPSTGTVAPPSPTGTAPPPPPPTNTPPPMADLYIADLSIQGDEPCVGLSAYFQAVIRNGGDAPSAPFDLEVWLTEPGLPARALEGSPGWPLAPGEDASIDIFLDFSESGPATLTAALGFDPAEDSNQDNNTAELQFTVEPEPLADLHIDEFYTDPEEPRVGEPAYIWVRTRNRSDYMSALFDVRVSSAAPHTPEYAVAEGGLLVPEEEWLTRSTLTFSEPGPATIRAEIVSLPSGVTICFEELVVNVRPAS